MRPFSPLIPKPAPGCALRATVALRCPSAVSPRMSVGMAVRQQSVVDGAATTSLKDPPGECHERRPALRFSLEDRRSRREERRAKQREQNVVRAEAMHRARLAFEAEGRPATEDSAPACNVGCSGWFYWHWRESFYPPDSSPDTWFRLLREHFGTVELNAPFYSWPTVATVGSWLRQCDGKPFVYTVKVNELITHTALRGHRTPGSRLRPHRGPARPARWAACCSSCRRAFTIAPSG